MLLTDEEIYATWGVAKNEAYSFREFARAIESAVLEKLKAQEPDAWRTFDGEGGYDYRSYVDNEKYQAEFLARNPSSTYKNWVEPLYLHPLPPADVVRDAERLDWLMNSGRIVICDRDGCYTYTHTSGRYGPVAKTQREAIDAAMKEMK